MTGIVVGEFHAFLCQLVNVGCFNDFLSVTTQITVAQIIHHNIDNIWSIRGLKEIRRKQQAKDKQEA
tara:strand:- start:217 stop:417 length:201 start_codon:yes stop_codon:yes gene_type:complete